MDNFHFSFINVYLSCDACFNVYIIVDLVKRGVLSPVGEIRRYRNDRSSSSFFFFFFCKRSLPSKVGCFFVVVVVVLLFVFCFFLKKKMKISVLLTSFCVWVKALELGVQQLRLSGFCLCLSGYGLLCGEMPVESQEYLFQW